MVLIAVLLGLACVSAQAEISSWFTPSSSRVLSEDWGYKLHWKVDGDEIYLGVEAKTEGWVGFGFAEHSSGSMPGADIMFGYYDESTSQVVIKDAHAFGKTMPISDESQDWELLGGKRADGVTMFAAKRKIDTGDAADRAVALTAAVPVIFARGIMMGGNWGYHGPDNRGTTFVDFRSNPPPSPAEVIAQWQEDPDVQYYELRNNYTFSSEETQYHDIFSWNDDETPDFLKTRPDCKDRNKFMKQQLGFTCSELYAYAKTSQPENPCSGDFQTAAAMCPLSCGTCTPDTSSETYDFEPVHVLGFEAIVSPEFKKNLHHFVVYGVKKDYEEQTWFAWAPGQDFILAPPECGYNVAPGAVVAMKINTHYDDPTRGSVAGKTDRSGVRVYYTKKRRPHNCGVVQLGDGQVRAIGKKLPKGLSRSSWVCSAEKTALLGDTKLNVVGSLLHMHAIGKRSYTAIFRKGADGEEKAIEMARNDFYDEAFQINKPVAQQTIQAGDELIQTCIHSSPDDTYIWGLGSRDEMCINFVTYWPEVPGLDYCGTPTEMHVPLEKDDGSCFAKNDCVGITEALEIPRKPQGSQDEKDCEDDPDGGLKAAGQTCEMMFGYGMQCDTDINTVDADVPVGTFLKLLCPKSCQACPNAQGKEEDKVEYTEVEANGLTFRCRITGEESSPNKVLFLHGYPEFAKFWFPLQNEWLATGADFHTVACDLRGYSPKASPDGIENYSYEIFAQDAWAIADKVGFEEFHLIGHDHGAGLGWLVASQPQAKSRIKSYTALSVPHVDTFSDAVFGDKAVVEQQAAVQYMRNFQVADSASRGLSVISAQKPLWWYRDNPMASPPYFSDEELAKNAENAEFSLQVRKMFKSALPTDDGAPGEPVGDIQVPVFFICGGKDPYLLCDHDYVKNQEALMKAGYRAKTYQSCAHALFDCEDKKDSASVMSDITAFLQPQADTACHVQKYRLVSQKFPALCLDASKPVASLTKCAGQAFQLHRNEQGTAFLKNSKGHCLSQGFKFGDCGSSKVFELFSASLSSFHLKLQGGRCLNARPKPRGKLAAVKCNGKARTQHFFLQPVL